MTVTFAWAYPETCSAEMKELLAIERLQPRRVVMSVDAIREFSEICPEVLDSKKTSLKYAKKLFQLSRESTGADLSLWEWLHREGTWHALECHMDPAWLHTSDNIKLCTDYCSLWNSVTEWMHWRKKEHGQKGDNGWFRHGVRLIARYQFYILSNGRKNWLKPDGKARQPCRRDASGNVVSKKRKDAWHLYAAKQAEKRKMIDKDTDSDYGRAYIFNHKYRFVGPVEELHKKALRLFLMPKTTDAVTADAPAAAPLATAVPLDTASDPTDTNAMGIAASTVPVVTVATPTSIAASTVPVVAPAAYTVTVATPTSIAASTVPVAASAVPVVAPAVVTTLIGKAHEATGLRAPPGELEQHLRTAARIPPLIKYLRAKKKFSYMSKTHWNCIREWCQTECGVRWVKMAGLDPLSFHLHHVKARQCGGLYSVYNCVFLPGSVNSWFGSQDSREMRSYIGSEASEISDRHAQWASTQVVDQSKFDLGM